MVGNDENKDTKLLLHERGICVVIPTYNNHQTIGQVVADALAYCDDVIVVNDGSTDDTAQILQQISAITVVTYPKNRGKGYALKQGIRKAQELGFAYAISMDADGQHYAKEIPSFLKTNMEHPGKLIVGNRKLEGVERSYGSSFANKFANFWFFIQTGRRGIDTQSGYRLYPIKKLKGLGLLTSRYEAELELLVFSAWHGTKLVGMPIDVYYPPREERVSHFRPAYDFARISVLNTCLCLLAIIYGLPLCLWRLVEKAWCVFFTCFFLFVAVCLYITPVVWIRLKCGKVTEQTRLWVHGLMWKVARYAMMHNLIVGTKFSYDIAEGVDFDHPQLIICNHQSHFDLLCMLIFHPKVVFLTNDWVWHNPLYGFIIRTAEYLPASQGVEELEPRYRSLVERGYSIAIFPEGTRSKDCRIGRFHQGAFYLANLLHLDILPMVLYGAGKVLPKKQRKLNKGKMHIEVDRPITYGELQAMGDFRQQAKTLRHYYLDRYQHLANKMERDA